MPTYDYICKHCGQTEEVVHPINRDPVITCDCGETMQRKVSAGLATLWRGAFSERALSKMGAKEGGTDDW